MANNICNGNHRYGPWEYKFEACARKCAKCGYEEVLPKTDSTELEIQKQEEASKVLNKFLAFDDSSIEAVWGIEIILSNCLNYLNPKLLPFFQDKVKKVGIANNLQEKSVSFIWDYVEKVKNYENTEAHDISFDLFMEKFSNEINELSLNENEKKATL